MEIPPVSEGILHAPKALGESICRLTGVGAGEFGGVAEVLRLDTNPVQLSFGRIGLKRVNSFTKECRLLGKTGGEDASKGEACESGGRRIDHRGGQRGDEGSEPGRCECLARPLLRMPASFGERGTKGEGHPDRSISIDWDDKEFGHCVEIPLGAKGSAKPPQVASQLFNWLGSQRWTKDLEFSPQPTRGDPNLMDSLGLAAGPRHRKMSDKATGISTQNASQDLLGTRIGGSRGVQRHASILPCGSIRRGAGPSIADKQRSNRWRWPAEPR